jgi:hypothetical protein
LWVAMGNFLIPFAMAGLVPAIHVFACNEEEWCGCPAEPQA